MTKTLAAVKQTVVFAGAAAAITISSVFLPATAAHAAPICNPQDAPCAPTKPKCQFQIFNCDVLPPVLDEDPPKPPKGPHNVCQIIDCDNIGEGQVLDPITDDPQPTPEPDGGNNNPTPDETPAPEAPKDEPKSGGNSGNTSRPTIVRVSSDSAPAGGQTVAGTEAQPVLVQDAEQVSESTGAGIPSFVWIVLSAVLSAAAALVVSRRKSHQN
jgi:hypothetical protein